MAWIKSHQNLERNPKLHDLMSLMGWDVNQTIGTLHRLWWWVVDYAEDGDLRRFNPRQISRACGVQEDMSDRFMSSLIECRFIDTDPYLRIHDWWDHCGSWLQSKYKRTESSWKKIRSLYVQEPDLLRNSCVTVTQPGKIRKDKIRKDKKRGEEKEKISLMWNATQLPKIERWSQDRLEKLSLRLQSEHFRNSIETVISKLSQSKFALGGGRDGWKVSIDWILANDTNYVKVLEGKYDDKSEDRFAKY